MAPGDRPVDWVVTGRFGGVSKAPFDTLNLADHVGDELSSVTANRELVAQSLGLPAGQLVTMGAVHGSGVARVCAPGLVDDVDALVTTETDLALVAFSADCATIAISGVGAIGVVHCGWRGLSVDVVGATVNALRADAVGDLRAVVGPAICGWCYPVPPSRIVELLDTASESVIAAAVVRSRDGQPAIDVRAGVLARLVELGVHAEVVGGCTAESQDLFSHRRDGRTGRQGMIVTMRASAVAANSA